MVQMYDCKYSILIILTDGNPSRNTRVAIMPHVRPEDGWVYLAGSFETPKGKFMVWYMVGLIIWLA